MRSVSIRQVDMARSVIPLGFEGENEFTTVRIDCKKTFDEHPMAVPSLAVTDPAGNKYPAVIVRDGNYVEWTITASDLTTKGEGEIQVIFTIDDHIVGKTDPAKTKIKRSIIPSGQVPSGIDNFIQQAGTILQEVENAIPPSGTTGQVLAKKSDADYDLEWVDQSGGGGGGTSNYNELSNKPSIGGVTLSGNKTLHDLGAATEDAVNAKYTKPGTGIPASDLESGVIPDVTGKADKVSSATSGNFAGLDSNGNLTDSGKKASDFATPSDVNAKYTKPQSGIPSSDMASAVQTSLGKADSAYQLPSGGIPSSDMASGVQTSLGKADTAYQLPSGGVPASDLASAVQTSLGKADSAYQKPGSGIPASDVADGVIPVLTDLIDDTAGDGDTDKVWSADKSNTLLSAIESLGGNTPEMYGAVGDGETDDTDAVQAACDAGYVVNFGSNKTYYLADTVTIDHDVHLIGGENTVIKTATPDGGDAYDGIKISGTLKKTTTLTTDYTANGNTDNCNNKFTLTDMTGIEIGDVMVIKATDQYYHYARPYYYLGASLLITDVYDGHLYTCDAMPYNITNTANVSVEVYSAPSVIVENLTFESSGYDGGNYKYLLFLDECKNSTIRDCTFTKMDNGIRVGHSVNIKISNVSLSKCKYDNSLEGDGYGIAIDSCTNTSIDRILATCAQHAITISGNLPAINTFIRRCDLTSECRSPGLDTHEAIYNLVVEDCVLGTVALNGVARLNRCRIINNRRVSTGAMSVSVYGNHNSEWSRIVIENTTFEGTAGIEIQASSLQNPVQAYNNVFGDIRIENCTGGILNITPTTNATILSNTIQNLTIKNWKGCNEIYVDGSWRGKYFTVADSTFNSVKFITDRNSSHGVRYDYFDYIDFKTTHPMSHKVTVCRDTYGENIVLPENVPIAVSSSNSSAKYIVCGANVTSDNIDDYCVGQVSGSAGGDLSRTVATGTSAPTIAFNGDGDLVFTQASNTTNYCLYPIGMVYTTEQCKAKISCTLKNTGNTFGATFRPGFAVVDCSTGKLVDRYFGTAKTASAQGETVSYEWSLNAGYMVLCYYYCSSAVSGSETTFENHAVTVTPTFAPPVVPSAFTGNRRTGDGTILSVEGVNNIMCSDLSFNVKLEADLSRSPMGVLPSGTGVSF